MKAIFIHFDGDADGVVKLSQLRKAERGVLPAFRHAAVDDCSVDAAAAGLRVEARASERNRQIVGSTRCARARASADALRATHAFWLCLQRSTLDWCGAIKQHARARHRAAVSLSNTTTLRFLLQDRFRDVCSGL